MYDSFGNVRYNHSTDEVVSVYDANGNLRYNHIPAPSPVDIYDAAGNTRYNYRGVD